MRAAGDGRATGARQLPRPVVMFASSRDGEEAEFWVLKRQLAGAAGRGRASIARRVQTCNG